MCGGRRIRQHGLCRCAARVRFLGGRLAGGQAAACRCPEDVPRIVEGYFGGSAAQDVQSVLYRYYLLMNLLVTASQLADEVQAGSIPPPEDPQAVLGQAATLEGTKACAAEVLGRMTRLCYRHQNVRYSAEISRAKEFIRENYADSGISLHMVAAEVGFSPNHFYHRVFAGDRSDLCRISDRCPHRGGKASADLRQQPHERYCI